jgi:uncharacterized phiE125 gp8 family phage protein
MGRDSYYRLPTLKLKTGPSKFPVTVPQVKQYLGLDEDNNDFNSLLNSLLDSAIRRVELNTGLRLITQSWYQYEFDWPMDEDYFELRLNPVQSVTAVKYKVYNSSSYTTWAAANYELDETAEPARLWLGDTASWPTSSLSYVKPIQIEFVAGFGDDEDDVDGEIVMAIKQMVEHWFENRGTIITGTIVAKIPDTAADIIAQRRIYF